MCEKAGISTRGFRESDLDIVRGLICEAVDTSYSGVYPKEAIQYFKDAYSGETILKDAREGYTIVLEKDGQLIGTGTLSGDIISRVFVRSTCQRRGYGRLIMGYLEERARSNGIGVINLHSSLASEKFYTSLGYSTLRKGFARLEDDKKVFYYEMRKALRK